MIKKQNKRSDPKRVARFFEKRRPSRNTNTAATVAGSRIFRPHHPSPSAGAAAFERRRRRLFSTSDRCLFIQLVASRPAARATRHSPSPSQSTRRTSPRPEPPFPRFSPPISSSLRDLIFDGEPCVQLV